MVAKKDVFCKEKMLTSFTKKLPLALTTTRITVYLLFFVVSQLLYQFGSTVLKQPFFDEQHYVPAAREFIARRVNTIPEHPPLGIALIAASIAIGGDRPFGWRLGSMLSGSLLLLGLLALCFACGMRKQRVVYVGALALCSHFIFIHARAAMLDIYLCAFIIWALVLMVWALFSASLSRKKILLGGSALLWGGASCVKWIGLPGFAVCLIYLLSLKVVRNFSFTSTANPHGWHNPRYLQEVSILTVFILLPALYVLGYALPHLLLADKHLLYAIREAWALQQVVPADHNYMSQMWQWPLMLRPLWFEYLERGGGVVHAIFCLGNPFLMVLGLGTLCWSVGNWLRRGSLLSFINVIFYSTFFFFWLLVERKVSYHYYYFLPMLFLLLSVGECCSLYLGARRQVVAWAVLALAILFFVFYYPLISGWPLPTRPHFSFWVWFDAWI